MLYRNLQIYLRLGAETPLEFWNSVGRPISVRVCVDMVQGGDYGKRQGRMVAGGSARQAAKASDKRRWQARRRSDIMPNKYEMMP